MSEAYSEEDLAKRIQFVLGFERDDFTEIVTALGREPLTDYSGANLQGIILQGENLAGIDFSFSNLEGANLEGANLEGANLEGANLEGANLEGANLEGANLEGANLEGTNLEGANLEGANLEKVISEGVNLPSQKIYLDDENNTSFQRKQSHNIFRESDFREGSSVSTVLVGAGSTLRTLTRVLRVKRRPFPSLDSRYASSPVFTMRPILHEHYTSDFFKASLGELQDILTSKGFLCTKSGCFDMETKEAVKVFQASANLVPDGIVGPLTWAALLFPTLDITADRVTSENATEYVIRLQSLLNEEGLKVRVDGCFNRETKQALKRFQVAQGLHADGVCGPRTWSVLLGQCQVLRPSLRRDNKNFLEQEWFAIEQLLIIASIQFGILFNFFVGGQSSPFWTTLAVSYVLAYVVPSVMEKKISPLLNKLGRRKFNVLRFAPYLLIGFLSGQILGILRGH